MALNKVILDKINQEITAAQDNAAALKIALIRLALFHALEEQNKPLNTIKEFEGVFGDLNDDKKEKLYMSPVAQEREQQEKDNSSDRFDNRIREIMASFNTDMDEILEEEVLVKVDSNDPEEHEQQEELRAQQEALWNGEGATVATEAQAQMALDIENRIASKTTLLKPTPQGAKVKDDAEDAEVLAVQAFIDKVRLMTSLSAMNPNFESSRERFAERTATRINHAEKSLKEILSERKYSSTEHGMTEMLKLAFALGRGTVLAPTSIRKTPEPDALRPVKAIKPLMEPNAPKMR
ncbi:MAG: hypothetical protein WC748_05340 [Legionellales bacterium]|jgi:hypothetical protein